jgi:hypothetical protein
MVAASAPKVWRKIKDYWKPGLRLGRLNKSPKLFMEPITEIAFAWP